MQYPARQKTSWSEFFTYIVPFNIVDAFPKGDIIKYYFLALFSLSIATARQFREKPGAKF